MRNAVLTLFVMTWAALAQAQGLPPLAEGQQVRVTDAAGKVTTGKVIDVNTSALRIRSGGRTVAWQQSDLQQIEMRRRDHPLNGALYGAGAGLVAGLIATRHVCGNDGECAFYANAAFLPTGAGIGAAAGALIDFSIRKFDPVFRAPGTGSNYSLRVTPLLSKDVKGAALSFTF
jgi:hypothetical protein